LILLPASRSSTKANIVSSTLMAFVLNTVVWSSVCKVSKKYFRTSEIVDSFVGGGIGGKGEAIPALQTRRSICPLFRVISSTAFWRSFLNVILQMMGWIFEWGYQITRLDQTLRQWG
jgi:hypothetical protein